MTDNMNSNSYDDYERHDDAHEEPFEAAQEEFRADSSPFQAFVDHQRRALDEATKALETLLPPGFKEHSQAARDEFIKGLRVLVDSAVEGLEREMNKVRNASSQAENDANKRDSTGKTKVRIEVG